MWHCFEKLEALHTENLKILKNDVNFTSNSTKSKKNLIS